MTKLIDPPELNIDEMNNLVGIKINNVNIYRQAFTHKSALRKYNLKKTFETLEFVGDAVLNFIVTRFLFEKYSDQQEGFLTKSRIKMVRGKTLAIIGEKMGLDKWILMDDKGMSCGWQKNPKVLEDVLEAIIGAIYNDLGLVHTRNFVLNMYDNPEYIDLNLLLSIDDNFKDKLIKMCKQWKMTPIYNTLGQDKDKNFIVQVLINNILYGTGMGTTKRQAEQNASMFTIKYLETQPVYNKTNYYTHAPYYPQTIGPGIRGPTF